MLTRISRDNQESQTFDAIAFEEERFEVFQRTETPAPLSDSALDANWDSRLGLQPTSEQWHDPAYRQAYLDGIAQKYDEKFGILI